MSDPRSAVVELAKALIKCPSVCPEDGGAQGILADRLAGAGFTVERLNVNGIPSVLAILGDQGPLVAFSGHSDVVPTGNEAAWSFPPFGGHIEEGYLFGRGAVDMKGPLAASIVAAEQFAARHPEWEVPFRLGFLIAGDEEVMSNHGTTDLLERLRQRQDRVDYCIVTESTSQHVLGDMVKIGRRGSLVGQMTVRGKQGHSAYPHLARNPIHEVAGMVNELCGRSWGKGVEGFPPTSLQVTNINSGTGASNVIPGELSLIFNFRFSPEFTAEALQQAVVELIAPYGLDYEIQWSGDADPFLTERGLLSEVVAGAIESLTGQQPEFSTSGGTSDARFIAPTGAQVIEFGTLSALCHQTDERVSVEDLEVLVRIYEAALDRFASALPEE